MQSDILQHSKKNLVMGTKSMEWLKGAIIGAGAFGTVCLAINNSNGGLFAVKSAAGDSVSCLENEFDILKSLDSPHVVKCLGKEYSNENGAEVCNLMMELMPGGSVGDLLSKFGGQLDESVIRSYTRGILRGLNYLHKQGIVHCDIKSKNVLVGCGGLVKLGDFGSARRTGEKGVINGLRGTPLWMAPEVVNQVEQGPPSDIWALGCTVVEMATGRPPWGTCSNPLAAMYRIGCSDELPELPACLSLEGRDFLEKCLRRDPKQRWTAAQLLEHPFLSETVFCCSVTEEKRAPLSPTSTLEFGSSDWDSTSSSTVPILSLAISRPCAKAETGEEKEPLKRPSYSAKNRLAALAVGVQKPDWCSSPPSGHWIVVRSNSPFSDTTNCSAGEETQSKAIMEVNDGEKRELAQETSVAETCGEEFKYEGELPSKLLIDQASEVCENRSRHLKASHHHSKIHGRIFRREFVCTSSATRRLSCFVNFVKTRCPKSMNGQLYISSSAETQLPNFISQLISVHLFWLNLRISLAKLICLFGKKIRLCLPPTQLRILFLIKQQFSIKHTTIFSLFFPSSTSRHI